MKKSIEDLLNTVAKLRAPDGCPWDKEQNHKTLKRYLIEETYETIDAIDKDDLKALQEELGDVLLQVALHAQIASENNHFNFDDVAKSINEKMISRHPHVFSDTIANNVDDVLKNWEALKKKEKPSRKEIMDGIPQSLPALLKARNVSSRASKQGFDWKNKDDVIKALKIELKELEEALTSGTPEQKNEELGDVLFMIVNLARHNKIDPEQSLNDATQKFARRFTKLKELSKKELTDYSEEELNEFWDIVKKGEKKATQS